VFSVKTLAHEKLKSLGVMLAVFGCVAAISWAIVNSHAHGELFPSLSVQEQARNAAVAYIQANHPETALFTQHLAWTGGTQASNQTYTFHCGGWSVTVQATADAAYTVKASYHAEPSDGLTSVPNAVTWQGTWTDHSITETNYKFTI
jgi:hypothetical protein